MAQQQLAQSDAALEAFDRLRIWKVVGWKAETASTSLAEFQSTAAVLEPEERIALEVANARENMELLKAVLVDPQASKICALRWEYDGEEDVHSIVPLLVNSCPELASLCVDFEHHSALDFVSSMLEHPGNKINVLEMPEYAKGDIPRFFAALGQSQVSALTLCGDGSPAFSQGLCDYLARDLLVRLKVRMGNKQVPSEVMMSLATCTRLAKLEMVQCEFSQPTAFAQLPKCITKLKLERCAFVGDVDWSFLADSAMQELDFHGMKGVDGIQLGSALAVHLREKGFDKLRFFNCDFDNQALAAVGVEIGRIKGLDFECSNLNDASIELIALALQSPSSELRELVLSHNKDTVSSIKNRLVPALRHPNCNLAELRFWAFDRGHEAAAKTIKNKLHHRRALFVLLQGQQVRRLYCPLQRLAVEMFRMVGKVLL